MGVKKGVKRTKNGLSLSKKEQETDQNDARFALPILTFEGRNAVSRPETGFDPPKSAILGGPKKGRFRKVYNGSRKPQAASHERRGAGRTPRRKGAKKKQNRGICSWRLGALA